MTLAGDEDTKSPAFLYYKNEIFRIDKAGFARCPPSPRIFAGDGFEAHCPPQDAKAISAMIDAQTLGTIEAGLVGTTRGLSEAADELMVSENELLTAIGEHGEIDLCGQCGWWCEMSELELLANELLCEDCRNN